MCIEFLVMRPRIGEELLVQFGQSRPFECKSIICRDEIGGHSKGIGWSEALDAGLFIWVIADLSIKLAILVVGTLKRLKGN